MSLNTNITISCTDNVELSRNYQLLDLKLILNLNLKMLLNLGLGLYIQIYSSCNLSIDPTVFALCIY